MSGITIEISNILGSDNYKLLNISCLNNIENSILNISCTIADAGLISSILWAFELREMILDNHDLQFGVRMHLNLSSIANSNLNNFSQYKITGNEIIFCLEFLIMFL